MVILSIDSGVEKTGYAVFSKTIEKKTELLVSGLIKTDKDLPSQRRINIIFDKLAEVVKKYRPETIVLEKLFFFKNQKTVIEVSQAQGIVLLIAGMKNIKIHFLTPLQIKESITGYGRADKKSIKKMIDLTIKINKKIKEDDEYDAIACGFAYCSMNQNLL
ncbi:crossover junction endodeoxyribonuclease RuvC [Candidatus Roizmanbacteria bacterium]|nr:crossover junction endodeoxyribonuclease RuvC [Candidatus Roizmanbacteria bacterium]